MKSYREVTAVRNILASVAVMLITRVVFCTVSLRFTWSGRNSGSTETASATMLADRLSGNWIRAS